MSDLLSVLKQDIHSALPTTSETGSRGEQIAARYLEAQNYRLVLSNFKVPIGRNSRGASVTGEIDIVALDGEILCFVEVKTRTSQDFAEPLANVNKRKQRQIIRAARVYRRIFGLTAMSYRYDAISIVLHADARPEIELIKSFWTESKFRKRVWSGDIY